MVTAITARKLALAFDETEEAPHHEVTSFRVKKKVFATMNEKEHRMTVRLTPLDQNVFCSFDENVVYPVPNGWGKHGWTHANLKTIRKEMLQDLLTVAYCTTAPKKLAEKYEIDLDDI
ncbi:MAG: MmcQ/YjbR family DNA-binding protein [Chitinophagales bacterium]|nr:MmcQ/YjbR family DNA-binding protein [Chitinophagaceae bacterium]MCB9065163.1 MmcQ/YjbR family DNA-binding protein [Chitinophagales bacterium]